VNKHSINHASTVSVSNYQPHCRIHSGPKILYLYLRAIIWQPFNMKNGFHQNDRVVWVE